MHAGFKDTGNCFILDQRMQILILKGYELSNVTYLVMESYIYSPFMVFQRHAYINTGTHDLLPRHAVKCSQHR